MDVRLPDGTTLRNVPDGTTKAQLAEKLQANGFDMSRLAPEKRSLERAGDLIAPGMGAPLELAAHLGSGIAATAAAGVAGTVQGVKNLIQGDQAGNMSAADRVAKVQEALTYQPGSEGAQKAAEIVGKPFELLAKGGDVVGQKAADAATAITGSEKVGAAVGAAINTGVQALPGVLAPELLGKGPLAARVRAARAPAREAAPPRSAPQAPQAPPPPLTLAENAYGPRPPPVDVTQGPIGETPAAPGAAQPAPRETPPPSGETPAKRAEAYARDRAGLDWARLSDGFKKTLTTVATDAGALEKLNPEAVKRQGLLQSRRIPISTTAGKLTRDATQLRNEANVAATDAGKPIRDVDIQANRALSQNIELLASRARGQGRSAAKAASPEQVGEAVQDLALRAKERISQKNYNDLYKKARETEPNAEVNPAPMYEFLTKNPEVQHLNWLSGWLKKAQIEIPEDAIASVKKGEGTSETMRGVRLEELDDLRKKAVGIRMGGGTDAHYAGEVIKAIDRSFDEVPEAATAWKAARDAFKAHKTEFEETGAIERQVGMKSRTDRATALEDTWKKAIKTASLEEIRQLKRSLLSGGSEATRLAGKQAIRELRSETVNQILKEARDKVVSTNEAGEQNITAAALNKAINGIGRDRLNEVLGRQTTRELYELLEAAKITKTEPAIRNAGSSTLQNVLSFLEKIPGGHYVAGAAKQVHKLGEIGAADREVRRATADPLAREAGRVTQRQVTAKKRKAQAATAKKGAPAAPLTLQETGVLNKKDQNP